MNYEFIIGTIIGVIGIIPIIISVVKWLRKANLKDLLSQLADSKLSTKEHRKILKKISRKLALSKMSISPDYINSFYAEDRGKEDIFLDICLGNNIEPTPDVCISFLGYNSPKLRKKWKESMINNNKTKEPMVKLPLKPENVVINNVSTSRPNVVYISSLLQEKFPSVANELIGILNKYSIPVRILTSTKDIWCRDYMPVQNKNGELIQFNYDPSYLKGNKEWEDSRSDVREVCKANNINPIYSDIIIDGGNVVLLGDKAILTDRIFSENPNYDRTELVNKLSDLLKAKIIIIPAYKTDVTGHADGMVRFINETSILGNDRDKDYKYIRDGVNKACSENGLDYIDIPFFEQKYDKNHEMNAIGIYVNYLEVGNLIIIPQFSVEGNHDQEALDLFKRVFPDRIIETINYNEVALEGGLLNCTTWTIFE